MINKPNPFGLGMLYLEKPDLEDPKVDNIVSFG
jgi:hypothetical protein